MKSTNAGTDLTRVFYCQVDTYLATKDYLRKGRCVRLIGVDESDYGRLQGGQVDDGINTFVLDIDLWTFILKTDSRLWNTPRPRQAAKIRRIEDSLQPQALWLKITADLSKRGRSYFYPTFSSAAPSYFGVTGVQYVPAPKLPPTARTPAQLEDFRNESALVQRTPRSTAGSSQPEFVAFHVGQGMCSMLHDTHFGVLFDAGAGTPITRGVYLEGKLTNELKTLVTGLTKISYMVLSHFDHDHWRMLAWDEDLLNKVDTIVVPDMVTLQGRNLAFFDVKVVKKVKKASSFHIPIDTGTDIQGHRSTPSKSDSNGECLVCIVKLAGRFGLVPGDYVYSRMRSDKSSVIKSLATVTYGAVIVPHHGDVESAKCVPKSAPGGLAFFSAGNHSTWLHPSPASEENHKLAGYTVIQDNTQSHIVKCKLL